MRNECSTDVFDVPASLGWSFNSSTTLQVLAWGLCGRRGVGPNAACQTAETTEPTFVHQTHGNLWNSERAVESWVMERCSAHNAA